VRAAASDPRECRRRMRVWARRWQAHRREREQWDLAELALGTALGYRDKATWNAECGVRSAESGVGNEFRGAGPNTPAAAGRGRVMSASAASGWQRMAGPASPQMDMVLNQTMKVQSQ
jgi:hypothetical protein